MGWTKKLILLVALTGLASCVDGARPSDCAGWRVVQVSEETLEYLAANDERALKEIIAHAEYGRARKCWK